jgi:hypothetical protein
MAQTYKTLAQLSATPGTLTNLYVTGASTQAVIGTILVSGQFETTNSSFGLVVRPINEALNDKHYIFRGSPVVIDETLVISGAITMNSNVILAANNYSGNAVFTVFGVEIT